MNTNPSTPTLAARAAAMAAKLHDRLALDGEGRTFDEGNPDTWAEADAAEPELVSLGQVRLRVLEDRDAEVIARAAGAITEDGPRVFCLLAELDRSHDAPAVRSMQKIVLEAEGVPLIFTVWMTGDDVHASPPAEWGFPADAQVNPDLVAMRPGELLLVMEAEEADDAE